MTKKQFNSICSLYHQGASREACIRLILDFCKKKNSNPASFIEQFYKVEIIAAYDKECYQHGVDINQLKFKLDELKREKKKGEKDE